MKSNLFRVVSIFGMAVCLGSFMASPALSAMSDTHAQILAVIDKVELAIDTKDPSLFMSVISSDFGDTESHAYQRLSEMITSTLATYTRLDIHFYNVRIRLKKGIATVTDEFIIEKEYEPKGIRAKEYGKDTWTMVRDSEGKWKITSIDVRILE